MTNSTLDAEYVFKVVTYIFLLVLILVSLWASSWRVYAEFDALVLFFIAYTLLLVLPISSFELSYRGFKGQLNRLTQSRDTSSISSDTVEEVEEEVASFSEHTVEPDTVLMKLSIEIETTLRAIADSVQIPNTKVSMGMLTRKLKQKEILTDKWLISALDFFKVHRNELIHEGRTTDIEKAIDVGRTVLVKLRDIQQQIQR